MSDYRSEQTRLKELGSSKFEVVKNENDIRGWTIKNTQGRILGKVNDLLFDIESEKVLYIVADLEGNELHLKDRKVLLPLKLAELQEAYKHVVFPGVMANELTELPTYEKGKITDTVEEVINRAFKNINETDVSHIAPFSPSAGSSNTANTSNKSRPQTVVGVFKNADGAKAGIDALLADKFKRNQIDISSKALDEQFGFYHEDDTSMTNWFKSVFGNDSDARAYSNAAKDGCVVTVQTNSMLEAELAARILDDNGTVKIEDGVINQKGYTSRILDRKEANSKWAS
jgi:hypothetical protein